MKLLYLLRHAKSSWNDPTLNDHERPLTRRGKRAAETIRDHLRANGVRPDLVLCSTARRAVATLDRITPGIGAGVEVRTETGLYAAGSADLLRRLREVPDAVGSVMVIAHNPGLQDLAIDLAGGGEALARLEEKFPTGALATLGFDGTWSDLGEHRARLIGFSTPGDLT
jgi:phosphohistidine phosphatase